MTETKIPPTPTTDALTPAILQELLSAAGPCLTLILSAYRPGEPGKPPAAAIQMDLQESETKLAARKVPVTVMDELLEPLRQLTHEDEALAGSGFARAIFRARGIFRRFELPIPPSPEEACVVGDCFWIRPLFPSLALPEKIFVLDLTKKSAALLVCSRSGITAVDFPKGTPRTIDEAMGFDAPDHDLVNRSAAGPSSGAMAGVKFGTGSGRETQHAHLRDFYRAIDRGVTELLHREISAPRPAPLILAGVDEDMVLYRSVNSYPHLVEQGIHGSPGAGQNVSLPSARMLRHAHDIALFSFERRIAQALAAANERLGPARFSVDLDAILKAAAEGRVSDLYLDQTAQRTGTFEGKILGGHANWHDEDLLNVAAVETLLAGGAVYSLATHWMPRGALAAASFRY